MARRHAAIASHDGWTVGGLRHCADALQYQQGDESRGHATELADGVCGRAGIARSFGLGSPHDDVSQLEAGAGVSLARHRASRELPIVRVTSPIVRSAPVTGTLCQGRVGVFAS